MKKNLKKQSSNTNLPNKKKKVNKKSHKQKKRVVRKKLTIKKNKKNKIINKNNETSNFKKMIGGSPEKDAKDAKDALLKIIEEGFGKIKNELKELEDKGTLQSGYFTSINYNNSSSGDVSSKKNIEDLDELLNELNEYKSAEDIVYIYNALKDGIRDISDKSENNIKVILQYNLASIMQKIATHNNETLKKLIPEINTGE